MPLYDGLTKIDRMIITDSSGTPAEIDVARLGTAPVFPDRTTAPVIDTFTRTDSNGVLAGDGSQDVTLTVTGTEGATFSIDVSTSETDITGTIPAEESTEVTWDIPANPGETSTVHTATISATGTSVSEVDPSSTTISATQTV